MTENVNICTKKLFNQQAPTPQNTPSGSTLISMSDSKISSTSSNSITREKENDPTSVQEVLSRNPGLVSMVRGKLSSLVGTSSGYIESLSQEVRRRIEGLQGLQAEYAKLEAEFQDEIMALEKKYHEFYQPLYNRRSGIINGVLEPTDEEVEAGRKYGRSYDTETKSSDSADARPVLEDFRGIPCFWLTAMKNISSLAEIITPEDEKALSCLTDIRMSYLDKPGFRLEFYFSDNEFFSNKMISKTYFYRDELGYNGDFVYDHAEGDKIDWKNNKDLTTKVEIKKQRNKNTRQTRVVKKVVPKDSFFAFFMPPVVFDQDDDSDIDNRLEADYQYGEDIKEKLIPRAIDWFTGVALAYEEEYDDNSDQDYTDEDENEDEEDEEDDDDDEDNEDNDNKLNRDNKPKHDPAECRQS
ncbi:hypothetical protein PMAC_000035 [Pneumocystis sp. 'macacae']|nr:hypothetical protein PMAC_000035 [Pneumocystis sp. 'macacae']